MKTVRIKYTPETASGRREGWAKIVHRVDQGPIRGAKAFDGPYLEKGIELDLEVGTLIIEVNPEGSVKNRWSSARILRLDEDGEWIVEANGFNWNSDFLSFRDQVARLLAEPQEEPPELVKTWKVESTAQGTLLTLNGTKYNLGDSEESILHDLAHK